MKIENLLRKHAKNFVGDRHRPARIQGITYTGDGYAYLTDGVQLLRVRGFEADGVKKVKTLSGKSINTDPVDFSRLWHDETFVCEINVEETLHAAKLQQSVLRHLKKKDEAGWAYLETTTDGNLDLGFIVKEGSGSTQVAENISGWFSKKIDLERFISCLEVFEHYADKVSLKQDTRSKDGGGLQLSAPDVDVMLMVVIDK